MNVHPPKVVKRTEGKTAQQRAGQIKEVNVKKPKGESNKDPWWANNEWPVHPKSKTGCPRQMAKMIRMTDPPEARN